MNLADRLKRNNLICKTLGCIYTQLVSVQEWAFVYHCKFRKNGKTYCRFVSKKAIQMDINRQKSEYFKAQLDLAVKLNPKVAMIIDWFNKSANLYVNREFIGCLSWDAFENQWYTRLNGQSARVKFPTDNCISGINKCLNNLPF